jgi:hypothetical protein
VPNPNSILIGKIVHWTNLGECEHQPGRIAGHGDVVATLKGQFILVRTIPEPEDFEDQKLVVLSVADPTLTFFDTPADHSRWFGSLGEPDPEGESDDRTTATTTH